ncbi:MAG: phosphatidylserine/phosphatidylglycerophosphate/cardiolipin synthase family protein [Bdellovibrionales bacterium]
MARSPVYWDEESLYISGDEYFAGLLQALDHATRSIELETYIFERGVVADRMVKRLLAATARGVQVRMIVDGWGSPGFVRDYLPVLSRAGIQVRFYRVYPWMLRRLPGDPENLLTRLVARVTRINRGLHRKFCLIDDNELWVGSFNISDNHLAEVMGKEAWKDMGMRVRGKELRYAKRAFQRAYRGWSALNWPAFSPRLLLLNDSFLHKRRTRLEHLHRLKRARRRIWLATPYFVPVGRVFRLIARQAVRGLDVRVIVPHKNDIWIMKWMSVPLLKSLAKKGVKVYRFEPRFSHQKVFIADDWICIGSTNLNHRSFLHDLEMDVVVTHEENKRRIIQNYIDDQALSQTFDSTSWAKIPFWKRVFSSVFLLAKYWS